MKTMLKKIINLILLVCIVCLSFCGCGKTAETVRIPAFKEGEGSSLSSGTVAENDIYELIWDDEKKCVLAHEKGTENYWSNVPYEHYKLEDPSGVGHVRMSSAFYLEYIADRKLNIAYSYVAAYMNGNIIAEEIQNGVRVTYYMSELEISVPLEYRIEDEEIKVSLDVKNICENDNLVYSISIAPFMCSAKNNEKDAYLFVPSGSGALMYVDDGGRNTRTFSGEVYGMDYATTIKEKTSNKENISMPVYGAKYKDNAVCAVITKGAEIARIDAEVGNIEYGYSSVYSTFLVRGVNTLYVIDNQKNVNQILVNTDGFVDIEKAEVTFTPLKGEKANYVGMASVYKDYLCEKYNLSKGEVRDYNDLYLRILGGTEISTEFLGFATRELEVSTTFSEAKDIVSDIVKQTGSKPTVQLKGYGHKGLDTDKIAGGLKFVNDYGKFKTLNGWCEENGINLYVDFDTIRYRRGGLGVSKYSNSAKTVNKVNAKHSQISIENYNVASVYNQFMLDRDKVPDIIEKVIKFSQKKNFGGISLETLGNMAYSDFSNLKGYNKLGYSALITNAAKDMHDKGIKVMTANSFDFAVVNSDCVISSVTKSSEYDGFDKDIPFYQIAFKGLIPMAVSPINTAISPDAQFLKAIETGSALSFALCDEWNTDLTASVYSDFQFCVYDIWKDRISEMYNSSKDYLASVKDAEITEHVSINENLVKTVFSNGVTVYVNYSDSDVNAEGVTVPASGFITK